MEALGRNALPTRAVFYIYEVGSAYIEENLIDLANGSISKLLQALTRIYKVLSAFFQVVWQIREGVAVERGAQEALARGKGIQALCLRKNILSKFG